MSQFVARTDAGPEYLRMRFLNLGFKTTERYAHVDRTRFGDVRVGDGRCRAGLGCAARSLGEIRGDPKGSPPFFARTGDVGDPSNSLGSASRRPHQTGPPSSHRRAIQRRYRPILIEVHRRGGPQLCIAPFSAYCHRVCLSPRAACQSMSGYARFRPAHSKVRRNTRVEPLSWRFKFRGFRLIVRKEAQR